MSILNFIPTVWTEGMLREQEKAHKFVPDCVRKFEGQLKKQGDKVTAGTSIAIIGNTGKLSSGDHLHFELWYKGEAINPCDYINF